MEFGEVVGPRNQRVAHPSRRSLLSATSALRFLTKGKQSRAINRSSSPPRTNVLPASSRSFMSVRHVSALIGPLALTVFFAGCGGAPAPAVTVTEAAPSVSAPAPTVSVTVAPNETTPALEETESPEATAAPVAKFTMPKACWREPAVVTGHLAKVGFLRARSRGCSWIGPDPSARLKLDSVQAEPEGRQESVSRRDRDLVLSQAFRGLPIAWLS